VQGLEILAENAPIYILATGGVRSLANSVKEVLWKELTRDLLGALAGVHKGTLHMQTLEGTDEALFGLLASNYIISSMDLSALGKPIEDPLGILDLGGSSLEVSIAGPDKIIGSDDDVLIIFKSLGLDKLRDLVVPGDGSCLFGTVRFNLERLTCCFI
jgi:hypothetical protein